ncbi:hypothetical protein PHOSAC3_120681 [Mesotoga infera]|nr:hypothetical protein PHOSAC3_120681 [Mesotoga infera]
MSIKTHYKPDWIGGGPIGKDDQEELFTCSRPDAGSYRRSA